MTDRRREGWVFEDANLTPKERRRLRKEMRQSATNVRTKTNKAETRLPLPSTPRWGDGMKNHGWWNLLPMDVPPHRATTRDLAAIYPFVADSGIGTKGPILGVDLNADSLFCFSPWVAYNDESERGTLSTNILVMGAYRAGKSGRVTAATEEELEQSIAGVRNALSRAGMEAQILYAQQGEALLINALPIGLGLK